MATLFHRFLTAWKLPRWRWALVTAALSDAVSLGVTLIPPVQWLVDAILANFKKAYETFPNVDFIARTPLIPGVNADEEHIRAVLAFIRPHKNVIDYELLPYHRFGLGKYEYLGKVYELDDYKTPSDDVVKHLQAIIDEAFGRSGGDKRGQNPGSPLPASW